MSFLKSIASLAMMAALSGCSIAPLGAERYSTAQLPLPTKEAVVLVVYRQTNPPLLRPLTVSINNNKGVLLSANSYFITKANSGHVLVDVKYPKSSDDIHIDKMYEGGTIHYLEIAGDVELKGFMNPYIEHWDAVIERPSESAAISLSECCRRINTTDTESANK